MVPSATSMTHTIFTRTSTLSPGLLHQHGFFSYQNDSYSFHQDFYTITRTLTPTGFFSYQHDSYSFSPGLLHYHQDSYTNMAPSAIKMTPSATNMTQTVLTRTSTPSPGLLHQLAPSATNMTQTVLTRTSTPSPGLLNQHGSFSYQHDSNSFHQGFYTITRTLTPTWFLQLQT